MKCPTCSRADLVRVLEFYDRLSPQAAELLGYIEVAEPRITSLELAENSSSRLTESKIGLTPATPPTGNWPEIHTPISFWTPFSLSARTQLRHEPDVVARRLDWRDPLAPVPPWAPISEWSSLVPRLRSALTQIAESSRIDVGNTVRRIAQGELLSELPRESVRRWGIGVQVILDSSERLIPFRKDQDWFVEKLKTLVPYGAIQLGMYDELHDSIRLYSRQFETEDYKFPPLGTSIIVLSDLGALSRAGETEFWRQWANAVAEQRHPILAVVPCSPDRVAADLRSLLRVISWQKLAAATSCVDAELRQSLVDQLFQYVAIVRQIEPGLLRAIRRLLSRATDASLESDFWQDSRLTSRHCSAAIPLSHRLPAFQSLETDERRKALQTIRQWRQKAPPEVWISEIWGLDAESEDILSEKDRECAKQWQRVLSCDSELSKSVAFRAWLAAVTRSMPLQTMARHPQLRASARQLLGTVALLGGDPQELPRGDRRRVVLGQIGSSLICVPADSPQCQQLNFHDIGSLETRTSTLAVLEGEHVKQDSFWKSGSPPSWASDWDRDQYGAWAEFTIDSAAAEPKASTSTIVQRMRWIPPGKFLMGSPEDEAGRFDDEGPQHEVQLTSGFWMFDTPVTQELWRAVMGDNPSHFQGDRLPVERVSCDDVRHFLERLNTRFGEVVFVLPTEAQWEYACRAGKQTAYWFGDDPKKLPNYAWYSDNSSNTTHPVAEKLCNPWGLYDIHGNVLEWCEDFWSDDYTSASNVNPTGPKEGHSRVLRGGGWGSAARYARSACRLFSAPGGRNDSVGFRCAQVQGGAEPTEEGGEVAEPQAGPTTGGAAFELPVSSGEIFSPIPIPASPILIVRSDMETLELHRLPKPAWASAMGRDRFGLWAEFTINAEVAVQPKPQAAKSSSKRNKGKVKPALVTTPLSVIQRMRWIPPGRFSMGASDKDDLASDDEKPQHEVILSHGYWLFDTPVTQELWLAVMNNNPSHFSDEGNARRPVEYVSWEDCQLFIKRINQSKLGTDGLRLTLPTEAEWEYACRAGTATRYSFGDEITPELANYSDTKTRETSEVRKFSANPWGLFDMHGNVWEWCFDWYDGRYYAASATADPVGPPQGHYRVLRGGSWSLTAQYARSAFRDYYDPGNRYYYVGFRCAQVHPSVAASREQAAGANERRDEQGADATPPDRSE